METEKRKLGVRDRSYDITIYPPPKDTDLRLEALKLLVNARQLWFGIAEDDIGVPHHLFDPVTGVLVTGGTHIEERKKFAAMCIEERKNVCVKTKEDKFALAKLVGAYVNMLGVIADETADWHIKKEAAKKVARESKDDHPLLENALVEVERCTTMEKTCMQETQSYYRMAHHLLPNVRLKQRKVDIDRVLEAQLGEVVKAAITPSTFVHENDYQKAANTMYEVDTLIEWMLSVIDRQPKLAPCRDLIINLGIHAKERLNLRREDLLARDCAEVDVRATFRALRNKLSEITTPLTGRERKTVRIAGLNLHNGAGVIYDMLKQGPKRASIALVMSIEQAARVTSLMQTIATALPAPLQSQIKVPLNVLKKATGEHLRTLFNDGAPSKVLLEELEKAMASLEAVQLDIPGHAAGQQKFKNAAQGIKAGIEVLRSIPGIIPSAIDINKVVDMREDAAKNMGAFIKKYDPKQREQGD